MVIGPAKVLPALKLENTTAPVCTSRVPVWVKISVPLPESVTLVVPVPVLLMKVPLLSTVPVSPTFGATRRLSERAVNVP